MPPGGIRTRQRAAADPRLRPRDLRDRQNVGLERKNCIELAVAEDRIQ